MHLQGKLIQQLPIQSGTSKNGNWSKQEIIIEVNGQFPKKVCISIWGEKINETHFQIGNLLKINFDLESTEYNGKWYTNLKAWKTELIEPFISPPFIPTNDSIVKDGMDDDIFPF